MERSAPGLRQYYVAVGEADAKLNTLVELLQALRADVKLALAVACSSRDSLDAVTHALTTCKGFNIAVLHADLELHDMEQQITKLKKMLQQTQGHNLQQQQQQHAIDGASDVNAPQQQQQQQQQQNGQPGQAQLPPAQQSDAGQQQQAAAAAAEGPSQSAQLTTTGIAAAAADSDNHPLAATVAPVIQDDGRSLAIVTSDVVLKHLPKDLLPLGVPLLVQFDLPSSKDVLQRRLAAVFGSSKERGRRSGRQVVIDFVTAGDIALFRARERMSSAAVLEMPVHVPDIFC